MACLGDEWLNISRGSGDSEQPAPNTETGKCVIDFCLGKQALGLCDFIDRPESRLITSCRLLRRRARGRYLDGSVGGYIPGAAQRRHRSIPLGCQVCRNLPQPGGLGPNRSGLPTFSGPNGREVERWESYGKAKRRVLNRGSEAVESAEVVSVDLIPGPAGIGRSLREKARKIRALKNLELRLQLVDYGVLFNRNRIYGRVQLHNGPLWRQQKQLGRSDRDLGWRQTHELRDVYARNFDSLLGLNH